MADASSEADAARSALERELWAALSRGETDRAADQLLRALGPEVLGFLVALCDDPLLAQDAYSQFCVELWRGLSTSPPSRNVRAWAYAVARHAASRVQRPATTPLSAAFGLDEPPVPERTRTEPHRRTEVKERFRALRSKLAPEERALLVLRVDRGLSWDEVSVALADVSGGCGPPAATLRKRFERLRQTLTELAREEGLLEEA